MDLRVNRRHCGGESVTSLPEGFRKEGVILSLILFRCAKRSILPDKTTLLENELARLQSEFHSTKSQNSINFLGVLFLIFFVQSGRKCFTAAVYFNPTNQLKKIEDGDRRNRNSGLLL